MCTNALSELESSGLRNVVVKRAQWEAFEVVLAGEGRVNVKNVSKEDPSVYTVTVENGVPESCTCKYAEYNEDPCKHKTHVAMNDVLMAAVTASSGREVATDGGETLAPESDEEREQEADHSETDCVDDEEWCPGPESGELPCFECFRARDG